MPSDPFPRFFIPSRRSARRYGGGRSNSAGSFSEEHGHASAAASGDLLTVEQAASHLQLSTSSIRSYIRQGRLKAFRIAGLRKVLIHRSELLALLEPARRVDGE